MCHLSLNTNSHDSDLDKSPSRPNVERLHQSGEATNSALLSRSEDSVPLWDQGHEAANPDHGSDSLLDGKANDSDVIDFSSGLALECGVGKFAPQPQTAFMSSDPSYGLDLSHQHATDNYERENLGRGTFIGINKFTKGTEFYGPTAELAFLFQLRSLAGADSSEASPTDSREAARNERTQSPFTADELYPDDNTNTGKFTLRGHIHGHSWGVELLCQRMNMQLAS